MKILIVRLDSYVYYSVLLYHLLRKVIFKLNKTFSSSFFNLIYANNQENIKYGQLADKTGMSAVHAALSALSDTNEYAAVFADDDLTDVFDKMIALLM